MLFLNLLNRLFGTGSSLSRKEIDTYVTSENEGRKQAIEEKSMQSDLESDALEGFTDSKLMTSSMSALDKKFSPKSNLGIYTGIATGLAILIVGTVIILNKPEVIDLASNNPSEIEEERTERETSYEIEKLIQVEEKNEIQPSKLIEEQTKIHAAVDNTVDTKTDILEPTLPNLPALPIDDLNNSTKPVLIIENLGKEIYLSNLKLLDYREYRSSPLKVEKYVLSGTSADKETKNSEGSQMQLVETDIAYIDYIEKSIDYFEKGKYKKALDRFEVILKNYEDDLNANFYGSLCYYNLGKSDKAIALLNKTLESDWDNFDQEANWFLATIYLEQKQTAVAHKKLQEIVNRKGFYAEQAMALLNK